MFLFISPPFGNYWFGGNKRVLPIRGSFTLMPRPGLLSQIARTLRYTDQGWVNKIGLRNRGLDWALQRYSTSEILSIAILRREEIPKILEKLPEEQNVELNVSCPNTDKKMISTGLGRFITPKRRWCIVKLSPLATPEQIQDFYSAGFRQFHCSNTLPTDKGGLSGSTLIPHTSRLVSHIWKTYSDVEVIAGGGVYGWETAEAYRNLGASHISVSTLLFSPLRFLRFFQAFKMKSNPPHVSPRR